MTPTLRRLAVEDPARSAIVAKDARLTYGELYAESQRISTALDHLLRGTAVGTALPPIVAVCLTTAFDTARLVVAAEAGDRIVTVIDAHGPVSLQRQQLATTGATVVITDSPALRDALRADDWPGLILGLPELMRTDRLPADPTPSADDAPFLLLTSSGTTGAPKAFLKTRAQYAANIDVSLRHLGAMDDIATFAPGPMSYSLTLYTLFEVLATGGRLHVADRLEELWLTSRVRDEGITRLVTVPAALHALADAATRKPRRYDGIERIITGGAALSSHARARIAEALPGADATGYFGTGELGFIGDDRAGGKMIRLYPQVEAQVRDDHGAVLPLGAFGTLWVRSRSCSTGYLPGTTTSSLTDADGWASVHDQGHLRGRDFTFVGRRGDVVTTGGHTVALDEVERAFDGMPQLGVVCAIAEAQPALGVRIALVVEGEAPPRAELRAWAGDRLAPASVPRRWYALPELPRTSGGKVRRAAVAELIVRGQGRR
ncbi:long-chain fatty acid--CoA ligase [Microbacterium luteolum]|uniref:Long-chain fatty acid--CoA ligase n=1 Tax=Microbacterium luteolum TaxID=69367 RepID=A0ABY7XTV6_MICLT|nr:long-chain fatty acid--CoA ligase [Microbacterium luteolum]